MTINPRANDKCHFKSRPFNDTKLVTTIDIEFLDMNGNPLMKDELLQAYHTIPWFFDLKPKQLESLVAISQLNQYAEGEELFSEGERADGIHIVLDGQFQIEMVIPSRGQFRVFVAETLDVLGWSSLTPVVRQRIATVRAIVPSRVISMDGEKLRKLCEEDHDLGYIIMKRVANVVASHFLTTRLQLMNQIVDLSKDTSAHR